MLAQGQPSGPDFPQPACPFPLCLVFVSLKSQPDSPLPCKHDVRACLNFSSWQKLRHKMDLEADETSLGISWAAGSSIPGVGWALMWGRKLSPPPVGDQEGLELKWGSKDVEPSDTLPRDLGTPGFFLFAFIKGISVACWALKCRHSGMRMV